MHPLFAGDVPEKLTVFIACKVVVLCCDDLYFIAVSPFHIVFKIDFLALAVYYSTLVF